MLSIQIRHENKICHGCRNRCETIWVCQKILALHQPASTAVQNLSAVHISHKLKYAIGWNFQVGLLGIFSAHFQCRLMLDYRADMYAIYVCETCTVNRMFFHLVCNFVKQTALKLEGWYQDLLLVLLIKSIKSLQTLLSLYVWATLLLKSTIQETNSKTAVLSSFSNVHIFFFITQSVVSTFLPIPCANQ